MKSDDLFNDILLISIRITNVYEVEFVPRSFVIYKSIDTVEYWSRHNSQLSSRDDVKTK